jgi:hypothetical protein
MDASPAFGIEECYASIVGDMARALSERHGETPAQQFARGQTAIHMIMAFLPRDAVEALLASHCVMLHELMLDSTHHALCAQEAKARHAEVHGLVALNKAFCGNLGHLRHYQKRPSGGSSEAADDLRKPERQTAVDGAAQARPAWTSAANQMASGRSAPAPASRPEAAAELSASHRPTDAAVTARTINPAAEAALKAGDPVGFAHAMGIERPSEAFLTAANAAGSPFDPGSSGPWPDTARSNQPKV